jgi:hypothetical protein
MYIIDHSNGQKILVLLGIVGNVDIEEGAKVF